MKEAQEEGERLSLDILELLEFCTCTVYLKLKPNFKKMTPEEEKVEFLQQVTIICFSDLCWNYL